MGYILARIHELKAELAAMPEVDPATREVTKLEAIRQLEPEIVGLRRKGYRLDGVITLLATRGVPITVVTLRTYLRRLDQQRQRNDVSAAPATAAKQPENLLATRKTRARRSDPPVGERAGGAAGNSGAAASAGATTTQQSAQKRQRQRAGDTSSSPPQPPEQPLETPEKLDATAVGTGGPSTETPAAEHFGALMVEPEGATAATGATAPPAMPERSGSARATPAVTSTKASFAPREDSEEI